MLKPEKRNKLICCIFSLLVLVLRYLSLPDTIMHILFTSNSNNYIEVREELVFRVCQMHIVKDDDADADLENNVYDSHSALALNFICMNREKNCFLTGCCCCFFCSSPYRHRRCPFVF